MKVEGAATHLVRSHYQWGECDEAERSGCQRRFQLRQWTTFPRLCCLPPVWLSHPHCCLMPRSDPPACPPLSLLPRSYSQRMPIVLRNAHFSGGSWQQYVSWTSHREKSLLLCIFCLLHFLGRLCWDLTILKVSPLWCHNEENDNSSRWTTHCRRSVECCYRL